MGARGRWSHAHYLTTIGAGLGPWFYVLAGGLAFGESTLLLGMFLPGETMLLVAGSSLRSQS
jgi:membrane protein DedA with SNARE-associated domain